MLSLYAVGVDCGATVFFPVPPKTLVRGGARLGIQYQVLAVGVPCRLIMCIGGPQVVAGVRAGIFFLSKVMGREVRNVFLKYSFLSFSFGVPS